LTEDIVGEFDEAIHRLNQRRAALDAEITALPADDPKRVELRARLRRIDDKIETLEEEDSEELTPKDRRMIAEIVAELRKVGKEADTATGEPPTEPPAEPSSEPSTEPTGEPTGDIDPTPEHPYFKPRGRASK
jgi:hypothetical protein